MRTHYSSEIKEDSGEKEITVAGWVHEIRDLGKLKFLILRDRDGFLQILGKKGACPDSVLEAINSVSRESVVSVTGIVKKSDKAPGGFEIVPSGMEVISAAETPLPIDVTQKVDADIDTRLDNRFLDLRKPDVAAIFKLRAKVVDAARRFLIDKRFIEVYTPKIIASASEGGTELFPISYFDKDAFLAQSPQLYKQMMMATGFDRVYEMTPYFRAESHDTRRHINEITAIDIEMSFIKDERDVTDILEGMVKAMLSCAKETEELKFLKKEVEFPKTFRRVTYDEALKLLADEKEKNIPWGEDLDRESENLLGDVVKEKYGEDLFFLVHYPIDAKPFYTMPLGDKLSNSFDLEYKGVEISSGGQRVHQPDLLEKQIKSKGLNPESFEFYLNVFRYGMPPHGGFGFGIDRIMMQMLDVAIREVVLFPRDRHRLTP